MKAATLILDILIAIGEAYRSLCEAWAEAGEYFAAVRA